MITIVLGYNDIFEDEHDEIYSYLYGIDKWILIKAAAFYCSSPSKNTLTNPFLPFLLQNDIGTKYEQQLITKLISISENNNVKFEILNSRTSLKFFELIQNFDSNPSQDFSEEDINKKLLKVYLILNQKNKCDYCNNDQLSKRIIANSLIYSIYTDINFNHLKIAERIKASIFFEYCRIKLPQHYSIFLEQYGISSWKEYITYINEISSLLIEDDVNSIPIITIAKNDINYDKKTFFFNKFCQQTDYEKDEDFSKIKANPVIKNHDTNEYYIIFEQFFIEKMFKGLFFTFKSINDKLKENAEYISNFRSDFGINFTEKTLLNSILNDALGKKYKHLNSIELKRDGLVDYYIRDGKYIYLFECKDNLINKSIIENGNTEDFINELKKIFIETSNEKNKTQKKAIKQLVHNIQEIRNGKFVEDKGIKTNNNEIYPIIISNNSIFSLEEINIMVNSWFFDHINDLDMKKNGIKNITIININTFILIKDLLRNNTLNLKNLIDLYWKKYELFYQGKYYTTTEVLDNRYLASISFDKFIELHLSERKIFFTNEIYEYCNFFQNLKKE